MPFELPELLEADFMDGEIEKGRIDVSVVAIDAETRHHIFRVGTPGHAVIFRRSIVVSRPAAEPLAIKDKRDVADSFDVGPSPVL